MIVEQIDAFKSWLTAVLKPMCEADPAALAKYVLALIKKDKSEEELRKSMVAQLDVFLEGETESFVNLVFKTLTTKEYIDMPVIPNANPPNPNIKLTKDAKMIISPSELPNLNDNLNGNARREREGRRNSETEDKGRRRHRSGSRNRSRSRSWDRSKRSRSREKSQHRLEREKRDRGRNWRNKSPPRRYGRRSRSNSPGRLRSRSRSPRGHRRYRSRTRSRSGEKRERRDSGKEVSKPSTPTQENHDGEVRPTNPVPVPGLMPKRRCRDFDEKGYCMRGEMCPFDHGVDPVVLEDAALTRVLSYNPNGENVPVGINPPGGIPPRAAIQSEYNPQAPQMWNRGFRGPRPIGPRMAFPPPVQRELVPVPVLDKEGYFGGMGGGEELKRKFDFGRLGPRKNSGNCSLELKKVPVLLNSITHLNNHFGKFGRIVNIQVCYEGDPEAAIVTFGSHAEANAAYRSTEAVLNNRFIKVFWHNGGMDGKQENVPPQRSIKERLGVTNIVAPNTNKVLNLVQPKAENGGEEGEKASPPLNKEETKAQATAAIKKNQELLAAKEKIKKNRDEQLKDVLKINNDLRKRKQELLEKQLSQQKILLEKTSKLPPGSQRDMIMETIKKTQESIEAIKKDLEQAVMVKGVQRKSKEEAQKEMLDAELDLITKQQEGGDTTELQKKISELRSTILGGGRGRGRGRRFNPIQRHLLSKNNLVDPKLKGVKGTKGQGMFQKLTVDHRPTRLLVSGFEAEEQEGVISHFQQFGEVVDYSVDAALPSVTLNYKTRKEAEVAMLKGKHFQDRTLSITWSNVASQARTPNAQNRVSMDLEEQLMDDTLLEGEEDLGPELSEEALLQDDEEEDDESEDRSWRR